MEDIHRWHRSAFHFLSFLSRITLHSLPFDYNSKFTSSDASDLFRASKIGAFLELTHCGALIFIFEHHLQTFHQWRCRQMEQIPFLEQRRKFPRHDCYKRSVRGTALSKRKDSKDHHKESHCETPNV